MSIKNIPDIKFISASHRCYEYVLDFVIGTVSVGKYLNAYHNLPVTTFAPQQQAGNFIYPACTLKGQASGKNVEFVPEEVLKNVFLHNSRNEPIAYKEIVAFPSISGASTDAVAKTLEGFAQAMFTRYWETNLSAIEGVHGRRRTGRWPSVLQFAAIIRDAMSHGGTIHMFPTIAPATHFGLTYSQSDNGKSILHNDLSCADIFFLLLDVDAAF